MFSKDFSEEPAFSYAKEEFKVSDFTANVKPFNYTAVNKQATSINPVGELENRDRMRAISPDNVYDRGSSPSLEADGYDSADSGSSILNEIPCHRIEDGKCGANATEENL